MCKCVSAVTLEFVVYWTGLCCVCRVCSAGIDIGMHSLLMYSLADSASSLYPIRVESGFTTTAGTYGFSAFATGGFVAGMRSPAVSPLDNIWRKNCFGFHNHVWQERLAANNPQADPDRDLDACQRTMAVRKSRSDKFLKEDTSAFTLLSLLTLHLLLQRVTSVAFKLTNVDKEGMGFDRSGADRARAKRRRMAYKGPHVQVDMPERYTLQDLFDAGKAVLRQLWLLLERNVKQSILCVSAFFWPADKPESEMLQHLTSDILKTICGLKFRLTQKHESPPFNMLDLRMLTSEEPGGPSYVKLREFEQIRRCCLDPFWGRPVAEQVAQEQHDPLGVLKDHMEIFRRHTRPVSTREEATHALQRKIAGGTSAKPRAFHRQAAAVVVSAAADHWSARGGRDLTVAKPEIQRAMKQVRQKKMKHKRPHQFGSAMFFYIANQMSANSGQTWSQWKDTWMGLSPESKLMWKRRHQLDVQGRRRQEACVAAAREARMKASDRENLSPWKIGDESFPLRPEWVADLLAPFSSKRTGLQVLRDAGLLEAEDRCRRQYHSGDAAEAKCKAHLGTLIDDAATSAGTWPSAQAAEVPFESCASVHPGLCDADLHGTCPEEERCHTEV